MFCPSSTFLYFFFFQKPSFSFYKLWLLNRAALISSLDLSFCWIEFVAKIDFCEPFGLEVKRAEVGASLVWYLIVLIAALLKIIAYGPPRPLSPRAVRLVPRLSAPESGLKFKPPLWNCYDWMRVRLGLPVIFFILAVAIRFLIFAMGVLS